MAHGLVLLWPGDILLSYACAALLVFPFRVLAVKKLLIIGIGTVAVLQGWNVASYLERVDLAAAGGFASAANRDDHPLYGTAAADPRACRRLSLLLTTRFGAAPLRPFTATGRMPLTTCMGALIIGGTLFSPEFNLWERYSFSELAAIAFTIMAVQLAWANLWLSRFGSGPLEWLWKSLAYDRRQPFQRSISGTEITN